MSAVESDVEVDYVCSDFTRLPQICVLSVRCVQFDCYFLGLYVVRWSHFDRNVYNDLCVIHYVADSIYFAGNFDQYFDFHVRFVSNVHIDHQLHLHVDYNFQFRNDKLPDDDHK